MRYIVLLLFVALSGCASLPPNVTPVEGFTVDRYLGSWYEIARLDHSFERGLSHVTAEYRLNDNGSIRVLNRGFSREKGKWKEAHGKAFLAGKEDQGFLKVSFFGPFYGAYVVCALDRENYRYALVCGPDTSYLWILARYPSLDEKTLHSLLAEAKAFGYNTEDLLFIDHRPLGATP